MRKKPLKICARPGCNSKTKERYCDDHRKHYWSEHDKKRGTRTQRGYDNAWYKFRKSYLHRNPLCVFCKKGGFLVTASEIDHIKPLADYPELKYGEINLRSLCKPCHSKRTYYEQSLGVKNGQKSKANDFKAGKWYV
jgi:5-methylcytosine-specific restriction protein A